MLSRLVLILFPVMAYAQDISLSEFLRTAWENSPVSRGEALENSASDEFVSSARGKYLPHLSLAAIDSTGFPASNSGLGVGGIMGSPFRSGVAGGAILQQTVYDFGRIRSALEQAKAGKSLQQARLAEDKFKFLYSIGLLYLACARTKTQHQAIEQLMNWAQINLKETARYTRTGQRSIVDNSLVQTEVDKLQLELEQLQKYQQSLSEQMRFYGASTGCKGLDDSWKVQVPGSLRVEDPSLLLAKAQIQSTQASYESAKAAQLPTLNVMASAGDMDKARLVTKQDYAAGVGIVYPIWNGGEDARRESALKAQADYQEENLKAAELDYRARLKNLRDLSQRNREALAELGKDLDRVRKTMKLATQRYRTLLGPLIDVREALRQLSDMERQQIEVMHTVAGTSLQLEILGADQSGINQ